MQNLVLLVLLHSITRKHSQSSNLRQPVRFPKAYLHALQKCHKHSSAILSIRIYMYLFNSLNALSLNGGKVEKSILDQDPDPEI